MIFLIKAFIVMEMIAIVLYLVTSIMRNIAREWFIELLNNHLSLVCSFMNQKIFIGPWLMITTEMLTFKIILIVSPLKFLGLTSTKV